MSYDILTLFDVLFLISCFLLLPLLPWETYLPKVLFVGVCCDKSFFRLYVSLFFIEFPFLFLFAFLTRLFRFRGLAKRTCICLIESASLIDAESEE